MTMELEGLAEWLDDQAARCMRLASTRDEMHQTLPDRGQHASLAEKCREESTNFKKSARCVRALAKLDSMRANNGNKWVCYLDAWGDPILQTGSYLGAYTPLEAIEAAEVPK